MKKILVTSLISIIIILVGIVGLIWFFSSRGEITKTTSEPTGTGAEKQQTYEQLLQEKEAQAKQDVSLFNKAISTRSIGLCENIQDGGKKWECRDTIIAIGAEASGSLETCATITSTPIANKCQDTIYQDIAIKVGDKTSCSKITSSSLATHCREAIDERKLQTLLGSGTVTEQDCRSLEEKFQASCLISVTENNDQTAYTKALSSNNIVYCTVIKDTDLRTTCSDTVTLKQALSSNSSSLCDKIQDVSKRTYCTTHIASKNEATLFKEYISASNLSGCATLTDTNLKNRCHDMVTLTLARTQKDGTLCRTLTNTGMIATCEQSVK